MAPWEKLAASKKRAKAPTLRVAPSAQLAGAGAGEDEPARRGFFQDGVHDGQQLRRVLDLVDHHRVHVRRPVQQVAPSSNSSETPKRQPISRPGPWTPRKPSAASRRRTPKRSRQPFDDVAAAQPTDAAAGPRSAASRTRRGRNRWTREPPNMTDPKRRMWPRTAADAGRDRARSRQPFDLDLRPGARRSERPRTAAEEEDSEPPKRSEDEDWDPRASRT